MSQLIGEVLKERYHIKALLGIQRGRRTLLAYDAQQEVSVVIKLLLLDPDFTWDDLKLFEREAEVLKALDHAAIPRYLDYFEAETKIGKGFALVQTHLEARSLQDWIQSGRSFSEEELTTLAKELLAILDYIHHRHPPVIHRDIKPSNILLSDRSGHAPGNVYLIDFGSVQTAVQDGTRTVVGTYGYMPPEQFGGRTTPASDLYALGATLIYLATGQHPDRLPQRDMRILFEDQVNVTSLLLDWLKWLTEPSTDQRLNSVRQALDALETSASRAEIVAQPAGSKVQVRKTRQTLEILIPLRVFYPHLKFTLGAIAGFAWFAFIMSNMGVSPLFAQLGFVGLSLWCSWESIFTLFGTVRVQVSEFEISLSFRNIGTKILDGSDCNSTERGEKLSLLVLLIKETLKD